MRAGGRPRDPEVTPRVLTAATTVLAELGMPGFTADDVAASASVGKASIYRRWNTTTDLLADVVRDLGVTDVPFAPAPGNLRDDLIALLHHATHGRLAFAEASVLSTVGLDDRLRHAYETGPLTRLLVAITELQDRSCARGDADLPSVEPIRAAAAYLLTRLLITSTAPRVGDVAHVVDVAVLPALRTAVTA